MTFVHSFERQSLQKRCNSAPCRPASIIRNRYYRWCINRKPHQPCGLLTPLCSLNLLQFQPPPPIRTLINPTLLGGRDLHPLPPHVIPKGHGWFLWSVRVKALHAGRRLRQGTWKRELWENANEILCHSLWPTPLNTDWVPFPIKSVEGGGRGGK